MQTEELRILLIDDDEEDYILTGLYLNERLAAPFFLEWVTTYQDAFLRVQDQRWDIILADAVEGHKASLDFVRKITSLVNTPVIMYTGFDFPWYIEETRQAGATSFLSKKMASGESLWDVILAAKGG